MKESLSQKILKYIRHPSLIGGFCMHGFFFTGSPISFILKFFIDFFGGDCLDVETSQAFNS